FAARRRTFETAGLGAYHRVIAQIRQRYAGTAVGASESIFAPLAQTLGLRLITPGGFLAAVSEGTDPTAADKATTDRQISTRAISVWIYNRQNTTPDVQRLNAAARRAGVPVTTITETPVPGSATFQARQVAPPDALGRAPGRPQRAHRLPPAAARLRLLHPCARHGPREARVGRRAMGGPAALVAAGRERIARCERAGERGDRAGRSELLCAPLDRGAL